MDISLNVLLGLQYAKLCNFYNDLRQYCNELNNFYTNTTNELLVALIVYTYVENNIEYITQIYYTNTDDNGFKKYTYTVDRENKNEKWSEISINLNLKEIFNIVKKQPVTHDLNHFYKNM